MRFERSLQRAFELSVTVVTYPLPCKSNDSMEFSIGEGSFSTRLGINVSGADGGIEGRQWVAEMPHNMLEVGLFFGVVFPVEVEAVEAGP